LCDNAVVDRKRFEPDEYFSSYDFSMWALLKAKQLIEEDKNIFLVGGTGFYIDMFTKRIEPSRVPPNFELRKKLQKIRGCNCSTLTRRIHKQIEKGVEMHISF